MSTENVSGPIDFVLLEFPDQEPSGKVAGALMDLVEAGIVRVYDILAIRKGEDGSISGLEVTDLYPGGDTGFTVFAGARSGLLGDEDVAEAAAAMEPGTIAVGILFENTWAIPFVAAARDAGGEMIATQRIPAQDIMDALDALEALES